MGTFDKIKSFVSDTAGSVQQGAAQLKLDSQIRQLKKDIDRQYSALGRHYFSKHAEDTEGEYAGYLQNIRSMKLQIETIEQEIRDLKGVKICEACGREIETASMFCTYCGAKQTPQEGCCPNCGVRLEEGARFCTNCGHSIAPAQPAEAAAQPEQPRPAEMAAAAEPTFSQSAAAMDRETADAPEPASEEPAEAAANSAETDTEARESSAGTITPSVLTAEPEPAAEPASEPAPEPARFCEQCGTELKSGAAFCTECGSKVH
ncbi:MAG: zinc ribbon domain-containing protein [Clostridia bacterium]|nr:zinc ribbon domain-containing protein [Clostridia bacterium]